MDLPSTKPYLLRALWEWCCDNGFTPYLSVVVDSRTRVPREFVRDGQIVLNVGPEATNRLQIGNDLVEFQARFGGVARELSVPIEQVAAIYARENGAGMAFEVGPAGTAEVSIGEAPSAETLPAPAADVVPRAPDDPRPEGGRPHLQRIK
ncbi:MAG: ClpXP protease specificity-enhancing factor [Azonexus sp.]|nr:ClpXP protease specificity-enhancing factor [Betaproteobacteria bacterium]MBK8917131.1 ClpXP protease specificity-enhancing factor [Betaproteobacteria bacterium]MBP6035528.1 ClpXP protease specificity-enhancing factor [Azonexus sp.]MBP6906238.1 ClpXP protease specificity-enhancing factor [Azonexus sp.]